MTRFCLAVAALVLCASVAKAQTAASPDGKLTASAKGGTIQVTDNKTQKLVLPIRAYNTDLTGLAYSPDGKHLAAVDKDGVVKLFDAAAGQELLSIKAGVSGGLSYSANGKTLTVGAGKKSKKFDVATGKETQ